jgi:alkane 1-monooxygenase
MRGLKYMTVYTGVACGVISLLGPGYWVLALPVYAFVIVPLVELVMRPDPKNMEQAEMEMAREDKLYDWLLYSVVPLQWGMMLLLLLELKFGEWNNWEIAGKIWAAGIGCGVLGINVAHELGHRNNPKEQLMAKILLLSSLYMHFFIEHNRGHHMRVSTPEDPASSRRGEIVYFFWIRSVVQSYLSAWELENSRLRRKGLRVVSLRNEMINYHLIQAALLLLIGFSFGWMYMLAFVGSAVTGFLLLETVNYIEHYGLRRERLADGTYERVQVHHSWNSNHPFGRLILFELSRHSDHHYRSGRKYQVLRNLPGAPNMPTGYPGMMVLAMFPPIWFWVMHRHIDRLHMAESSTSKLGLA